MLFHQRLAKLWRIAIAKAAIPALTQGGELWFYGDMQMTNFENSFAKFWWR